MQNKAKDVLVDIKDCQFFLQSSNILIVLILAKVVLNRCPDFLNIFLSYGHQEKLIAIFFLIATTWLHELAHGIAFWALTGENAYIKLSILHISISFEKAVGKKVYIAMAIAPFILLSLFFSILIVYLDETLRPILVWCLILNIGGSFGDLYSIYKIILLPNNVKILDKGEKIYKT